MSDDKKFNREDLAAELEAKAKALRENIVSDEEVDKMSAGCSACCGGCTVDSGCWNESKDCLYSCTRSSPN